MIGTDAFNSLFGPISLFDSWDEKGNDKRIPLVSLYCGGQRISVPTGDHNPIIQYQL